MRVRMAGSTDIGRVRKMNQDSMFYDDVQGLAIVADGIGGRKGGEIASRMAVEGLRKAFLESDVIRHEEIKPFLTNSFDRINQKIIERGAEDVERAGMGTTLNCLMFVGDRLHIAHVGDSRTYMFHKGHLWQLTIDHSVKTFVERGWIPKSQVQQGMRDSALVRSLGLTQRCEMDLYEVPLRSGEIFLTCSDGLSGMVDDRRMAAIIRAHEDNIEKLPRALIAEANKNGGRDNITVVISQVDED